ncbi:MAG: ACT domain-containing protein [Actinomycetota bacterium]|nr:ACT domain-containing protein [Actinomycetota bacterium]
MSVDIVIEVDNKPGALAALAAAVSDAGVNLAAATFTGGGEKAELHILVPHAEPVRHALAVTHASVATREHEVVVVEVEDNPGVLADLTRKIAEAGINIDTIYVATGNRVVFGSDDIAGLKKALGRD